MPAWDCHYVSAITFRRSACERMSFLLQNIFLDSKKICCDFSVGIEEENEELPFQCLKINKYEHHFLFLVHYSI